MRRRSFLRLLVAGGSAIGTGGWPGVGESAVRTARSKQSVYGRWITRDGLPAFVYAADQDALAAAEWDPTIGPKTRRHWVLVGSQAIRLEAANDGTVAVFDEGDGLRWLTAADPVGTGVSVLDDGGKTWGSAYAQRAGGRPPRRTFGPTWFEVEDAYRGLVLTRTILCPEGEAPWLLVRVRLQLGRGTRGSRAVQHVERWALRPRFLNLFESAEQRRARAELAVGYDVTASATGVTAVEQFADPGAGGDVGAAAALLIGPPATLVLERLGDTEGVPGHRVEDGAVHPTLEIATSLTLRPGERRDLWFRFGRQDATAVGDPAAFFDDARRALSARLPRASAPAAREAAREIPWHAAMLSGGVAVDRVIGGHSLDQASAYSYMVGFNGAARDPLQHALPLVYVQPALALSVLRNTCAWATPEGKLPYALDGAKRPTDIVFKPSDPNLWALWLAAEYAAATGDLAAFDQPLAYHPTYATAAAPLREHLRRQFRYLVDVVGRGAGNHVRILNADWNDLAISESGVDPQTMIAEGGSVLNSAMAAWVLRVFGGLATRLGETALAAEAVAQADDLRALVAQEWNGRWFHRAVAPGGARVGDADCWLEVQPWAMLSGAADATQARALLRTIDAGHAAGSPVGARLRWPAEQALLDAGQWGDGTRGGIWYAIGMTLVWAAAHVSRRFAWDQWRRMTLAAHTAAYPEIWEGTLSGPDAWNGPESTRPGRTWTAAPAFAMQAFPVNNMHSHAQPLLAYLRLLGVEPTADGSLAIGNGGSFRSRVLGLGRDGHGSLVATGDVVLTTRHGTVRGGPGEVQW